MLTIILFWYLVSLTIWSYILLQLSIIDLMFYQQKSNWLFEHYRTLPFLLGQISSLQ